MTTSAEVRELLEEGHSYETAGRALRISPGQAYMIATGLPADGSGTPSAEGIAQKWVLDGSSQHLSNPPSSNPTRNAAVMAWVRARAARELEQPR